MKSCKISLWHKHHINIYIYIYIHACRHTHKYTYIHTYIYTYIHTVAERIEDLTKARRRYKLEDEELPPEDFNNMAGESRPDIMHVCMCMYVHGFVMKSCPQRTSITWQVSLDLISCMYVCVCMYMDL